MEDWVRNLFRSGAAFMIVAALSLTAGVLFLVRGSDFMGVAGIFMGAAVVWFIIAIAVSGKNITKNKRDTES